MVQVLFQPANLAVRVPRGTTILEAARLAGVTIDSPCNGAVVCGKCAVEVHPEQLHLVEQKGVHCLPESERSQGKVLACAAEALGDLVVRVVSGSLQALKIASQGSAAAVELAPHIVKRYLADREVTAVYAGDELIAHETGDTRASCYGVVVDIGTTTLVVSLVDLNRGAELACASSLNPQSRHAQDVLSRIKIGSEPRGLAELRDGVVGAINELIDTVTAEAGVGRGTIYEAIFSGNTCMLHLAVGADPGSLGQYPYASKLACASWLPAAQVGIGLAPGGLVYLPPVISGYLGADITAGLQAVRLKDREDTVLFVDIGTNGEMALVHRGRIWATSTAAGPAFEGMNIRFGMRAGEGAIERVKILPDVSLELQTIGGASAVGICGSGLLDCVSELVLHGVVGKNGRFVAPGEAQLAEPLAARLVQREGKTVFLLTEEVWLTQKDLRQVQLAKGAIRAGVEFLLAEAGVSATELARVQIAGSFGFHLSAGSLTAIGLLPESTLSKIEFVGNTAKSGGEAFLLNRASRLEMAALVSEISVVELANCRDFDKVFVGYLSFAG